MDEEHKDFNILYLTTDDKMLLKFNCIMLKFNNHLLIDSRFRLLVINYLTKYNNNNFYHDNLTHLNKIYLNNWIDALNNHDENYTRYGGENFHHLTNKNNINIYYQNLLDKEYFINYTWDLTDKNFFDLCIFLFELEY
jgi:hypothetical protein